jgi:hypothetical protein
MLNISHSQWVGVVCFRGVFWTRPGCNVISVWQQAGVAVCRLSIAEPAGANSAEGRAPGIARTTGKNQSMTATPGAAVEVTSILGGMGQFEGPQWVESGSRWLVALGSALRPWWSLRRCSSFFESGHTCQRSTDRRNWEQPIPRRRRNSGAQTVRRRPRERSRPVCMRSHRPVIELRKSRQPECRRRSLVERKADVCAIAIASTSRRGRRSQHVRAFLAREPQVVVA